jgi:hypothetical protein
MALLNWIMWSAQYYIRIEAENYAIDKDIVIYVMLTNKMHNF